MEPSRPEKILIAMNALSKGTTQPCKYEDIVVKAFEMFPKDFQLRGHPNYPDSSDIHKPLYGPLKRQGLVRAANKNFSLTERGLTRAAALAGGTVANGKKDGQVERLSRDMENEVGKASRSSAAKLFAEGQFDRVLDTDFYSYLGITVRTKSSDFEGRLKTVSDAVKTAARLDPQPINLKLLELHNALLSKFDGLIQKKLEGKL